MCVHAYVCVMCMEMYIYVGVHLCRFFMGMCMHMYVCECMHLCMYAYVCMCIYVWACAYMYTLKICTLKGQFSFGMAKLSNQTWTVTLQPKLIVNSTMLKKYTKLQND